MTFQRSGVTLAQLLAIPTMPINQTPLALITNTPMAIQMTPIATAAATLA